MLYQTFATLASLYTVLAVVVLVAHLYLKHVYGVRGSAEVVNKLAGTKKIVVFEIYSYLSLAVWFALVLPWVDLFTFQKFSHFAEGGLQTYFGFMTSKQADMFFVVMFMNILGAKAAMTLAELAGLLRRGRVQCIPHGWFLVWKPE